MLKIMKLMAFIALTLVFITACADEATPEPTPQPTAAPVEAPTEEPPADPTVATNGSDSEMNGMLSKDLVGQLDAFLQSQIYTEGGDPDGAVPGLVLLVDTPDGRYLKAAGVANLEDGTPMQVDDVLQIGSNTKSMTVVVLLQLVEEGLLSLDDPLSQWLPEQAEILPNGDQITLRQLAKHTSGIWDYGDPIIGAGLDDPALAEKGFTPAELVQYAVENGAPDFAPGEPGQWNYSNTGYILLGMVLEQATDQSLDDLYQTRIFDPLGLESAVLIEDVPQPQETSARGYVWRDNGEMIDGTNWNGSQGWAAGSLAMTAADLATYGHALANGQFFHNPETLAEMLDFNPDALEKVGSSYGMGLMDFAGDGTVWGHEGSTLAFQSLWYTNPEDGIVVVGLTNSGTYSGFAFLNVLNILEGPGLQPFQPVSLLPLAAQAPGSLASKWELRQGQDGSDMVDVPPGFILTLAKDNAASLAGPTCGPVDGTFEADAQAQIMLEFDLSAVTCPEGDPTLQLIEALQSGGTWRFENGGMIVTLSEDSSQLVFVPAPPPGEEDEEAAAQSCPLFELPYPRPEPDYSGKLVRDLSPFEEALAANSQEQAAALETLVSGKTILELQGLMESGELTSADLVLYYLDRIQRYDIDRLNAVLELNPEVIELAQSLDNERAAGNVRGDMHGIPVLLKDNIATGDQMHTAAGAAAMLDWDPDRDAFLVSQLRDAGAIILGKANLSEWANYMDPCMPNGFSTNGGQTQNPYGPFETFGSSSGSAVAVAADLTTVSVGSETQGSLISPASINSVVALKPTKGLISTDYIIPLLPFQDVPGPMGRTVTDVAVLLSAMTGEDANDFTTSATTELAGVDFTQFLTPETLQDVRVGLPVWSEEAFSNFFAENDITEESAQEALRGVYSEQDEFVRAIGETLEAAGVTVVEIPITEIPPSVDVLPLLEYGYKEAINSFLTDLGEDAPLASLEAIIAFNNEDPANRAPYGQGYLEGAQNTAVTAEEFAQKAQENNGFAKNRIDALMAAHDLDIVVSELSQLYAPAGYPALTVPAGYAEDGTPQGVVFVGGFLSDPQLLAVGYAYEQSAQARVAPDLEATMALIDALDEPAEESAQLDSGALWRWSAFTNPADGEMAIDESENYTFSLVDGKVILGTGCRVAVGDYEIDGDSLALTYDIPEVTDESCPEGPQADRYFELLQGAASYFTEDGRVFIDLMADGGTLAFDLLSAPLGTGDSAGSEADEYTLTTSVELCGEGALEMNEVVASLDSEIVSALDDLLLSNIDDRTYRPAPGVSLLVISPEGRYFKSTGVADVTSCEPLPADALFEIGSNTKMMTAATIYQLQEEEVLSTSDPISQWVPDMAAIVPNGDEITIDMLLTHTSGIYDYINGTADNGPLYAGATDKDVLTQAYTPEELVRLAVDSGGPYFEPGAEGQWMYSNTGYVLLGMIIEAATGKTYEENLQERIFEPLGLENTFLLNGQPEPGLLPQGYVETPFDYTTSEWNLTQGWSAGAVVSNAEDMAVFLKALFSGQLYQDPATLDSMLELSVSGVWPEDRYYGHGMFYKNGLLGHGGQALGYQSDVGYLPDEDVTIVIWGNSAENGLGSAAVDVAQAIGLIETG